MQCPFCNAWTEVKESRPKQGGVRRRRECANGHAFTTREVVEVNLGQRDRMIADAVVLRGKTTKAAALEFGVKTDSYASRCVKRYYPNFNTRSAGQKRRREEERKCSVTTKQRSASASAA